MRRVLGGLAVLFAVAVVPGTTTAVAQQDASRVLPGPPILYAPPAVAPQLQNTGIWTAPPILISGASAYRNGEFIYQDFLYDDHGARATGVPEAVPADPSDRRGNNQFSAPSGTYTYPSDRKYAENAADLVEVRVKPLSDATAFRFTLNTMLDPTLIGISIALGGTAGTTYAFPFGANVSAPADRFVTVHPDGHHLVATLSDATGTNLPLDGRVSVDVPRRQIEVRVPHDAWDPTGKPSVRLAAAVGLWNSANHAYLIPQQQSDATHPGGAVGLASPPAFFNVAFRAAEPGPVFGGGTVNTVGVEPTWWRDDLQANALGSGDISRLHADVDFVRLASGVDDESQVPKTGAMDRILASHFEPAQGANYASSCYGGDFNCQYQGRLQPFLIYIPSKPPPPSGYGMTLLLHANAANYNEFFASRNQSEFGERGTGSIVITPQARDPGSSYTGLGAADVFEVWADVAQRFHLDPTWQVISGYSLGGLGVYKLGEAFPDLFSRAVAIVGSPGGLPQLGVPYTGETTELQSLRNLPIMIWDVIPVDELNPYPELNWLAIDRLGYRYDYLSFPGEHLSSAINDEFGPAAAFLGNARVEPNPAHVTLVYDVNGTDALGRPFGDYPRLGLVADHAYWLSDIKLRSPGQGTIDAISHAFGVGDPTPSGPQPGAGVLVGGAIPVLPYLEVSQTWGAAPSMPREDRVELTTNNVSAVTVDAGRAQLDCNAKINVHSSDGPVAVSLRGCEAPAQSAAGAATLPNTAGSSPVVSATASFVIALLCVAFTRAPAPRHARGRGRLLH